VNSIRWRRFAAAGVLNIGAQCAKKAGKRKRCDHFEVPMMIFPGIVVLVCFVRFYIIFQGSKYSSLAYW
jgi:hypothetical protein